MPRYKYSCKPCQLSDVRQIEYEWEHQTERNLPMCPHCGTQLTRDFIKPPKAWFVGQRFGWHE